MLLAEGPSRCHLGPFQPHLWFREACIMTDLIRHWLSSRSTQSSAEAQLSPLPREKRHLQPKDWWIQASPTLPMLLESIEKTISHDFLLCLHFILFYFFFFLFPGKKRQLSCTKGGNIEQEMKMSGVCICVTEQGAWMHGALQNISLCFSNIRGGCSTQGNAQTGLSLLLWFVWHTAHVSVKML